MTDSAVVKGCSQCGRVCSMDELTECLFCDEEYCYKCDGDCSCYAIARTVVALSNDLEDRGILPLMLVQSLHMAGEGQSPAD